LTGSFSRADAASPDAAAGAATAGPPPVATATWSSTDEHPVESAATVTMVSAARAVFLRTPEMISGRPRPVTQRHTSRRDRVFAASVAVRVRPWLLDRHGRPADGDHQPW
jgi:hypothetical protein